MNTENGTQGNHYSNPSGKPKANPDSELMAYYNRVMQRKSDAEMAYRKNRKRCANDGKQDYHTNRTRAENQLQLRLDGLPFRQDDRRIRQAKQLFRQRMAISGADTAQIGYQPNRQEQERRIGCILQSPC